jgi:hypothetical protein
MTQDSGLRDLLREKILEPEHTIPGFPGLLAMAI